MNGFYDTLMKIMRNAEFSFGFAFSIFSFQFVCFYVCIQFRDRIANERLKKKHTHSKTQFTKINCSVYIYGLFKRPSIHVMLHPE